MQVADGLKLPGQDQCFLVASVRHDLLQLGLRKIGRQLVLEDGLGFPELASSARKSWRSLGSAAFSQVCFSAAKKRNAVSQAKWRSNSFFQRQAGLRGLRMARRNLKLARPDQADSRDLPPGHEGFVDPRKALLIFEGDDDCHRCPDDGQERRRHRQKMPVQDFEQDGGEQRPGEEVGGFPPRPDQKLAELVLLCPGACAPPRCARQTGQATAAGWPAAGAAPRSALSTTPS